MRTLLIIIALVVIVMIIKRLWLQPRQAPKNRELTGKMVQCENCGIFFPAQEALEKDGHHYCSREHRDASKQ
jgi:uncharacterized protein